MIGEPAFKLGDPVVYQGKTYRFPGEVCAITDDGQIVVRAFGAPNGDYAGMKHIFGPSQLVPLALRPGSETDGFVLVPREPTEAMVSAGQNHVALHATDDEMMGIYRAMLAAAGGENE